MVAHDDDDDLVTETEAGPLEESDLEGDAEAGDGAEDQADTDTDTDGDTAEEKGK